MGALMILGTPPDQARRLPAHLACRVVDAAAATREDVAAFLAASGDAGGESMPLAFDDRSREERRVGR